jgi:hypothetical protein
MTFLGSHSWITLRLFILCMNIFASLVVTAAVASSHSGDKQQGQLSRFVSCECLFIVSVV